MDANSYPFNDPKSLAWNRGALAGWTIVGMNHYNLNGVRALFVAMTKGDRCVKAEGTNEIEVFAELDRKAAEADAGRNGSTGAAAGEPARVKRPADPLAKSVPDLVSPRQLGMIRERARQLKTDPEQRDGDRADELCLLELKCKTEELSKFAASYFIQTLDDWISGAAKVPEAKKGATTGGGASKGGAGGSKLRSVPATDEQKSNITSRKERLRRSRAFPDDELKRELAAVGCTVPKNITAMQATQLLTRLDELIIEAEKKTAGEKKA